MSNLTKNEEKELQRLLGKRGCTGCGQRITGPHFCPGPSGIHNGWTLKNIPKDFNISRRSN